MGGPAGVADPHGAVQRFLRDDVFEDRELAFAPPDGHRAAGDDGYPRGIVSPVFKPPEPVKQQRAHLFRADIARLFRTWSIPRYVCCFRDLTPRPGMVTCFDLATARELGGMSLVMVEPAPMSGIVPHPNRRDKLRVRADEDAVADSGRVFIDPVVVARDGSGPHVDVFCRSGRRRGS